MQRFDAAATLAQADELMPHITAVGTLHATARRGYPTPDIDTAARIHGSGVAAGEELVLLDPARIGWPQDFYGTMLLHYDEQAAAAVEEFYTLTRPIPRLRQAAGPAAPSVWRRLFRATPDPAAVAAAEELGEALLAVTASGLSAAIPGIYSLVASSVDLQRRYGVALEMTNPLIPEDFVATARRLVAGSLGLNDRFATVDLDAEPTEDPHDAEPGEDSQGAERTDAGASGAAAVAEGSAAGATPSDDAQHGGSEGTAHRAGAPDAADRVTEDEPSEPTLLWGQFEAATLAPLVELVEQWRTDPNSEINLRTRAEEHLKALTNQRVELLLGQMPIESLKAATNQRLRFNGLDSIGVHTVADVLATDLETLTRANGIGHATARRMKAAAHTLASEAAATHTTRIGDEALPAAIELVSILHRYGQVIDRDEATRARTDRIHAVVAALPPIPLTGTWVSVATHPEVEAQLLEDVLWVRANPDLFSPRRILDPGPEVWADYLADPARYQALLASLLRLDAEHTGDTDADTIAAIRALSLCRDHLKPDVHLRGYQDFGAKFGIVRKKIVLGDDMGLGKTIQAIAFAAHLIGTDPTISRAAVICPASVVLNWMRELNKFTTLPAFKAHGPDKEAALADWKEHGGFLVCTYDGARVLDLDDCPVLIVDEAHMIKNPTIRRSKAIAAHIDHADYTMLLTGTPLENRVQEFVALIRYVQPELVTRGMGTMAARDFTRHIAPAYLRRNQQDVLDELPERLEENDAIDLTAADQAVYADAVRAGNWMAMRRAAYAAETTPAKLERITDLVAEAADAERRVLIFSYFLDVLDRINTHLGDSVVGTITGAVTPTARQEMVDALGNAAPGSVLLAQITAGGVGLNIQAASVVILAEPQVKPTIEDQAIARAFRMGQTRKVHVHRLIGADTVDERMMEILATKRGVFDAYARTSHVAEDTPDAIDITESQLAATIIAAERERLGFDATEPITTDFGAAPAPAGIGALPTGDADTSDASDTSSADGADEPHTTNTNTTENPTP